MSEQKPPRISAFQFVSIVPRRAPKNKKLGESLRAVDPDTMIDPKTLKNILEIQKQHEDESNILLHMEQIGTCGIPSLWTSQVSLLTQRYIPRELILLLEKYHKMYAILKSHKRWENEKMFGKSAQAINFAAQAQQDFQYFSCNKLVSKYNIANAQGQQNQTS